jgi:hypothetical protein
MPQSYIVSYDLRAPDDSSEDYEDLIAAIKAYGYWGRLMLSAWIVVSEQGAEQIRDDLQRHMAPEDRIFVAPVGKPAAWRNIMAKTEWMKNRP